MTAQAQWGYRLGDEKGDVTYSPNSGTAPAAEVRVSWEDALTREQILIGLAVIEQRILETDWPPAP